MPQPPSFENLEKYLPQEPRHEAVATIRGFDWQRWLTIKTWLRLREGESLWIEWAEDFSILSADGPARTVQAKDQRRACTLNQRAMRELVSRAFERPSPAETLIWMTSEVGMERGSSLGEPAISHWISLSHTTRPVDGLRAFLAQPGRLTNLARQHVLTGTKDDFRQLLKRVEWVTGAPQINALRGEVEKAVLELLNSLGVKSPQLLSASTVSLLFDYVGQTSIRSDPRLRRLTASELIDLILHHNVQMNARAVATSPGSAPAPLRPHRLAGKRATPMSAAWFVYTEESIPLLGRDGELEKLQDFAANDAPFSWWAIGGPAGMGKSRLAQTFLGTLADDWQHGFVDISKVSELESYIVATDRNAFVVIDYASRMTGTVGRALAEFAGAATAGRKLRVLLLDRDVSETAEWLGKLAEPFTARAAVIDATKFQPPLELPDLRGKERELVSAWLEAAELDSQKLMPARKSYIWQQIRRLTGSRPLHLGLAAAAFANGDRRLDSPEDLLDGVLRREFARWRDKLDSVALLHDCLDALATATVAWGFPIPWAGEYSHWHVYAESEEAKARYFPEKFHARPPSYEELLAEPLTRRMAEDLIEEAVERTAAITRPSVSGADFTAFLWQLRDLTGGGWRIEPDLIGEYFLARYWDPSIKTSSRPVLPAASDSEISRQLWAAWQLEPHAVLFSLAQLREHDWARGSVVRAFKTLGHAIATEGKSSQRLAEIFATVLHDSLIRVGTGLLDPSVSAGLMPTLKSIQRAYPRSSAIAYLYMRRLESLAMLGPKARAAEHAQEAYDLLGTVLNGPVPERVFLYVLDLLPLQARHNPSKIPSFTQWLKLTGHLHRAFKGVKKFDQPLARTYFSLTALDQENVAPAAGRELTIELWITVEKRIRLLILNSTDSGYDFAIQVAEILGNLSVEYRRKSLLRRIENLLKLLDAFWGERPVDDRFAEVRTRIVFNILRASDQLKRPLRLLWALSEGVRFIGDSKGPTLQLALMEMHSYAILHGVNERLSKVAQAALTSFFEINWEHEIPEVHEHVLGTMHDLEFIIGATRDKTFIKACGKVVEHYMWREGPLKLLKKELREQPIPDATKRDVEATLDALLRYVSLNGLSIPSELKLGRLLFFYYWRFKKRPPQSIEHGVPFELRGYEWGVEVILPQGAFPGIVTCMPFQYPDLSPEVRRRLRPSTF